MIKKIDGLVRKVKMFDPHVFILFFLDLVMFVVNAGERRLVLCFVCMDTVSF